MWVFNGTGPEGLNYFAVISSRFPWVLPLFSFILGSILGSFLNVIIYRLPRSRSPLRPGSFCPSCRNPIRFYDNIPLISYLFLKGRCRGCGVRIPIRYFLVEALTAILSLGLFLRFGPSPGYLIYLAFLCALIAVSFIDLEFRLVPDVITLPGITIGLISSIYLLKGEGGFLSGLTGGLVGGGGLYLVAAGYYLCTRKEGMGGGDIKLMTMIGAFLGIRSVPVVLLLGAITGTVFGLALILLKGVGRRYPIPFGPFLSMAAGIYVFFDINIFEFSFLHANCLTK